MYNVFFIADPHIGHKNILRHQPQRVEMMNLKDSNDVEGQDEYIINTWLSQTKRGDHIYVLGDFIMGDYEYTRKTLHRLKSNGCIIHLIVGNHDKQVLKFPEMFESIDLIKDAVFKPIMFPFLKENLKIVMCHYPLLSWEGKCFGSIMMHGHTHDNSPWENDGYDIRVNVGIDTPFSNGRLISLEEVYEWYLKKLNGLNPHSYIEMCTKTDKNFVR